MTEAGRAVSLQLDTGEVGSFAELSSVRPALGELEAERFDFLVNNDGTFHGRGSWTRPMRS
jgi:hypothetical protein